MTISDDELLALAKKATPGEWTYRRAARPVDGEYDYGIGAKIDGREYCIVEVFGRVATDVRPDNQATAAYIAAASPQTIISLIERHRAEMEAVTRERDALFLFKQNMRLRNDPQHDAQVAVERAEAAESALAAERKRVGELEPLLRLCADELAIEIEERNRGLLDYPSVKRKYDLDMDTVIKARAALKERTDV